MANEFYNPPGVAPGKDDFFVSYIWRRAPVTNREWDEAMKEEHTPNKEDLAFAQKMRARRGDPEPEPERAVREVTALIAKGLAQKIPPGNERDEGIFCYRRRDGKGGFEEAPKPLETEYDEGSGTLSRWTASTSDTPGEKFCEPTLDDEAVESFVTAWEDANSE